MFSSSLWQFQDQQRHKHHACHQGKNTSGQFQSVTAEDIGNDEAEGADHKEGPVEDLKEPEIKGKREHSATGNCMTAASSDCSNGKGKNMEHVPRKGRNKDL